MFRPPMGSTKCPFREVVRKSETNPERDGLPPFPSRKAEKSERLESGDTHFLERGSKATLPPDLAATANWRAVLIASSSRPPVLVRQGSFPGSREGEGSDVGKRMKDACFSCLPLLPPSCALLSSSGGSTPQKGRASFRQKGITPEARRRPFERSRSVVAPSV